MVKTITFILFVSVIAVLLPLFASAQTIQSVLSIAKGIVGLISPLIMTIGVAVFIYGIVRYIAASGDEEKIKSAKGYIVYGLLGLFVMVAFWGIVTAIVNTFGLGGGSSITLPPPPSL